MEMEICQENCKRKRDDFELDHLPQVGIIVDNELLKEASKLPNISERAFVVHKLIEAYDLLRNLNVYKAKPATENDLCNFHSGDYIKYLKSINHKYTPEDDTDLDYGLGYDCPPLDGLFDYCQWIAGGTLTAARILIQGHVDIAINWTGGWHHAHRYEAEGFCYVNDIVLGILEMRQRFNNILYIDLDVHHGDGVEECFELTDKVFTVSFHQFEPGFYPGTGAITSIGSNRGKYHTVNIPLRDGIKNENYCNIFDRVLKVVNKVFTADAIVIQCGADGLSGDPIGGFNLTEVAYAHCVKKVLAFKKPTLILGGGGYNIPNTARCWTYLTSVISGCEVDSDIPEHENFSLFGPSYELTITNSNRKDKNTPEYIELILNTVEENLSNI